MVRNSPQAAVSQRTAGLQVQRWLTALTLTLLVACASGPQRAVTHTVKRGDTLYSIAQRYAVDVRDLKRWNGIGRDNVIHPGQKLTVRASGAQGAGKAAGQPAVRASKPVPKAAPALPVGPPVQWQWPVDGGTAQLTARPNGGSGLMVRGTPGQEIKSAASGRVVYRGTGLLGYGQLLIIKHNDSYLSAYGHTASVVVSEGDYVAAGQRIGAMGTDQQGTPALYFEIRVNGAPGNPLAFLPPRPVS